MKVGYHQNKNGVGELNEVSHIQMNNLARDVEKEEVIGNCNSDVKVRTSGRPMFDEHGDYIGVGE